MRIRLLLASAAMLVASTAAQASAVTQAPPKPREGAVHAVPLYGTIVRLYDAPANPFAPGHRGIDVAADLGTPVRSSAGGTVTFAGSVAGNRSVTVDHGGGLVTTYSYLASTAVSKGRKVALGDIVGTLGNGQPGSGLPPSVHLSARRNGVYFDPLELYVGSGYADLLALTR